MQVKSACPWLCFGVWTQAIRDQLDLCCFYLFLRQKILLGGLLCLVGFFFFFPFSFLSFFFFCNRKKKPCCGGGLSQKALLCLACFLREFEEHVEHMSLTDNAVPISTWCRLSSFCERRMWFAGNTFTGWHFTQRDIFQRENRSKLGLHTRKSIIRSFWNFVLNSKSSPQAFI